MTDSTMQCLGCEKTFPATKQFFKLPTPLCWTCINNIAIDTRRCKGCKRAMPINYYNLHDDTCDKCILERVRSQEQPAEPEIQLKGHPPMLRMGNEYILSKSGFVYFIECKLVNRVKIGVTRHNLESRLKAIQANSPVPVALVAYIRTQKRRKIERSIHRKFAEFWLWGEWFTFADVIRDYIEAHAEPCYITVDIGNPSINSQDIP